MWKDCERIMIILLIRVDLYCCMKYNLIFGKDTAQAFKIGL